MNSKAAVLMLLGMAALLCLTAGCSGPGQNVAEVRGDAVRTLAEDHVTAVLMLRRWLDVLYKDEGAFVAAVRPQNGLDIDEEYGGENSDGSTFHYIWYVDWSGEGTITWPDGTWKKVSWDPDDVDDAGHVYQDTMEEWSDGTTLSYRWTELFDPAVRDSHQTWGGAATMPGGLALDFNVDRNIYRDILTISAGDGTSWNVTIPIKTKIGAPFWPDFETGIAVEFAGAGGKQQISVKGGPDEQWYEWTSATEDGSSGTFALGEGLTGSGELMRDGRLLGTLAWDAEASGTLNQVGLSSVSVMPSEIARRFAVDRWVHSISIMGPAPEW